MATTRINTTGAIPAEHVFEALDGLRESSEPGDFVRVEWPHRGGWIEFGSIEALNGSPVGGINTILVKACQNAQTQSWANKWSLQMRVCDELGTAILSTDRKP